MLLFGIEPIVPVQRSVGESAQACRIYHLHYDASTRRQSLVKVEESKFVSYDSVEDYCASTRSKKKGVHLLPKRK